MSRSGYRSSIWVILTLNEVDAHVDREEGQRGVMIPVPSIEKFALVSNSSRGGRGGRSTYSSDDRDRLKCEHCGHFRHTNDQCWDLHGRLLDLAPRSSTCGGFGNGREGGCPGKRRPSAHSFTSTPTELSIMTPALPPLASPNICVLSSDEITSF